MRKLVVLPTWCDSIGGTTVSLAMTIQGFEQCGAAKQLCVLVQSGSLLEQYLEQTGHRAFMQLIKASNQKQFFRQALQWVHQQPQHWPLLLESSISGRLLPTVARALPDIRFSRRPVYIFFHDLAHSHNPLGNWMRKLTFAGLSPRGIGNSQFTAHHVRAHLNTSVEDVLYQPVDTEKFKYRSRSVPPAPLQPIFDSGAQIMLTPSRISQPGHVNDKNLRSLISVLAQLKAAGYYYHGVIIGEDYSPGQMQTHALQKQAQTLGVAEHLTILPPTFAIEDYYRYADVVVTLAPREPFGRTVVEAIACGVPVVGSQTGGVGEILRHFAPEWTVAPDDPSAAARVISCLASDPRTDGILAQGRQWVEAHCSLRKYANSIMSITGLNPQPSCSSSLLALNEI